MSQRPQTTHPGNLASSLWTSVLRTLKAIRKHETKSKPRTQSNGRISREHLAVTATGRKVRVGPRGSDGKSKRGTNANNARSRPQKQQPLSRHKEKLEQVDNDSFICRQQHTQILIIPLSPIHKHGQQKEGSFSVSLEQGTAREGR